MTPEKLANIVKWHMKDVKGKEFMKSPVFTCCRSFVLNYQCRIEIHLA